MWDCRWSVLLLWDGLRRCGCRDVVYVVVTVVGFGGFFTCSVLGGIVSVVWGDNLWLVGGFGCGWGEWGGRSFLVVVILILLLLFPI